MTMQPVALVEEPGELFEVIDFAVYHQHIAGEIVILAGWRDS